jgi:hypothetical protein
VCRVNSEPGYFEPPGILSHLCVRWGGSFLFFFGGRFWPKFCKSASLNGKIDIKNEISNHNILCLC